jgi:hypothetical protein
MDCAYLRFYGYRSVPPAAAAHLVPSPPFQREPHPATGMAQVAVAGYVCPRADIGGQRGPVAWARTSVDVRTDDARLAPATNNFRVVCTGSTGC